MKSDRQANLSPNQTTIRATSGARPKYQLSPLHRNAVWGLLFLYLLAATPLAPSLTALAAAADDSHHVAVTLAAQGPQVVLYHEGLGLLAHHHGPFARALTLFARPSGVNQPDHVIQFGGAGATDRPPAPALLSTVKSGQDLSAAPVVAATAPGNPLPAIPLHAPPPAPPKTSIGLLSVSTTIFLI